MELAKDLSNIERSLYFYITNNSIINELIILEILSSNTDMYNEYLDDKIKFLDNLHIKIDRLRKEDKY